MLSISEIEDKMDKTINYINGLKLYYEKDKSYKRKYEIQDISKYVVMSIENLYYILRGLAKIHNSFEENSNFEKILEILKDSYVVSDKCYNKIIYIQKKYDDIVYKKKTEVLTHEFEMLINYLDDIVDEILNYIYY